MIVYTKTDFVDETRRITNGLGVDLILDAVGQTTFSGDLDAVRPRGHIVVYGGASGLADPIVPNSLMSRALTLSGGNYAQFTSTREELLQRANEAFAGIREGWLKFSVDRILSLSEAAAAHEPLESRATSGKVLLTTNHQIGDP